MEAANESARAAVNALLATAGSSTQPPSTYQRYSAPELATAKRLDAKRYRHGQPNLLDTPWPGT
jgi:hypothetical protein